MTKLTDQGNRRFPEASIVIVNWNVRELLHKCLQSIIQNDREKSWEVLVVDNFSKDGSSQMLKAEFAGVKLIANEYNLGFAAASNQGIRQSCGEYVLLLNPDTEIVGDAIKIMVGFMKEHQDVGVVGCKVIRPDGSLERSRHAHINLLRTFTWACGFNNLIPNGRIIKRIGTLLEPRFHGFINVADENKVSYPEALKGACILLRRKALDEVGLLDEDFYMYCEEFDLCYRLRKEGWKVAYAPDATIIHHGGQSAKQAYRRMSVEIFKSHALLYEKHHGQNSATLAKAAICSGNFIRLLLYVPALLFQPRKLKTIFKQSIDVMKWVISNDTKCSKKSY